MRLTSPFDGRARAGLRIVLACVLAFDALLASRFLLEVHPGPASHPLAPRWLLAFAGHAWLVAPVAALALVSLVVFARRPARLGAGCVALAALALLVEAHAATIEGPYRIFFSGGATMLGWLVGAGYARATGRDAEQSERHAEFGAAAGLAATYVDAFASKIVAGGIGWTDADSLRAIVLTQHHVNATGLSSAYAAAIADHAWLARTLVTLTLLAQASAVAYPWRARARAASGALLLAFHANTAVLTPLFFPEAMVLLLALSFPWPAIAERLRGRPASEAPVEVGVPARSWARARATVAGGFVVASILAWVSPLRSYTLVQHRHASCEPPLPGPRPEPPVAQALVDLPPGAHVGDWEVSAVTVVPAGARLDLATGPRRLHVLVVRHGSLPGTPPRTTRDYDILYETGHPGETTPEESEIDPVLQAIARAIEGRE